MVRSTPTEVSTTASGRKRSFVSSSISGEILARELGVLRQVEAAAVVDPLDLLPAEGEEELDVDGLALA